MTLTPNFNSGFGPVIYGNDARVAGPKPAQAGTPAPGPNAVQNGGVVDFGNVEQNQDYVYRYAVQIAASAPNGFQLFGESGGDLSGPSTLSVATHLYWLPTLSGKYSDGTTGDINTTYSSPSTPFILNRSPGNGAVPPIYTSQSSTATLGYDFILRLGATDPTGYYNASISYSVVAL